jgi:hypothetical protein
MNNYIDIVKNLNQLYIINVKYPQYNVSEKRYILYLKDCILVIENAIYNNYNNYNNYNYQEYLIKNLGILNILNKYLDILRLRFYDICSDNNMIIFVKNEMNKFRREFEMKS